MVDALYGPHLAGVIDGRNGHACLAGNILHARVEAVVARGVFVLCGAAMELGEL